VQKGSGTVDSALRVSAPVSAFFDGLDGDEDDTL